MKPPEDYYSMSEYQWRVTEHFRGGGKQELAVRALGMAGESGETIEILLSALLLTREVSQVTEILKREIRGDEAEPAELKRKLTAELGDVLAYLTAIASYFDLSLRDIALANLQKLENREKRGNILGIGSDR